MLESLPVCKASADGMQNPPVGKTFPDCSGAGSGKYLRQGRLTDIAGEVAAVGDFNICFFELFQLGRSIPATGDFRLQVSFDSLDISMCTMTTICTR
jgi:hypothetical protein